MSATPPVLVFSRDTDETTRLLQGLRRAVTSHPIAAQSVFSALVAEGRRYARTEEGAAVRQKLEGAELVHRARIVWETLSLSSLSEHETDALPSTYIDAVVRAASLQRLEALLSLVFQAGSE